MQKEIPLFSWPMPLQWKSPSGKILYDLLSAIPATRATPLVLFGSAALQMTVAPSVLSADVDVFPDVVVGADSREFPHPLSRTELSDVVKDIGYAKGSASIYIQVCSESTFEPGPRCWRRAMSENIGKSRCTVPDPYDILFTKLQRYEAKDLEAFQAVLATIGQPDEKTLLDEMQSCYRFFIKPSSPRTEEHLPRPFPQGDLRNNVRKLWVKLYGRPLNIEKEIIQPALEQRQSDHADFKTGHKALLASIVAKARSKRTL